MATIYVNLDYEAYKRLEEQLRRGFEALERTHLTPGCYHKSIRLDVGGVVFEFQGPVVQHPPASQEVRDGASTRGSSRRGDGGRRWRTFIPFFRS